MHAILLVLFLCGAPPEETLSDSLARLRAQFPTPEQIEDLHKHPRPIYRHNPRLRSACFFSLGYASIPTADADASFERGEARFGFRSGQHVPSGAFIGDFGLRVLTSSPFGLFIDYSWHAGLRRFCLGPEYVVLKGKAVHLSCGLGFAYQKIQLVRDYEHYLEDGGTLKKITIASGAKTGGYISLNLDMLPADPLSAFAMQINARYIVSKPAEVDRTNGIRLGMHGLQLTLGPVFTF